MLCLINRPEIIIVTTHPVRKAKRAPYNRYPNAKNKRKIEILSNLSPTLKIRASFFAALKPLVIAIITCCRARIGTPIVKILKTDWRLASWKRATAILPENTYKRTANRILVDRTNNLLKSIMLFTMFLLFSFR